MHAYLVIGNNQEKRQVRVERILKEHNVAPHAIFRFPQNSQTAYGIAMVREIKSSLVVRTTNKGETRAIIIEEAHLLTTEAQNAFLKTLEEAPPDTIIILSGSFEDRLLPTIRSRCVTITTTSRPTALDHKKQSQIFTKLQKAGLGERVGFAEEVGKRREDALEFVEQQLIFLHTQLHSNSANILPSTFYILHSLLFAHQDLARNVNPKMVLFEVLKNY